MFDIGFFELLVIAIISLIVIGPERLPETIRTISLWIGRFKRSLRDTRSEIEKQLGADEIRQQLHNEEVMRSLNEVRQEVQENLDPQRAARMQNPQYDDIDELPDHAHLGEKKVAESSLDEQALDEPQAEEPVGGKP